MSTLSTFDTLIQNAKIFNNGEPAIVEDIAIVGGNTAWENNDYSADFETKPMGRLLKACAA